MTTSRWCFSRRSRLEPGRRRQTAHHGAANFFLACLFAGLAGPALAHDLPLLSHAATGGDSEYIIQPADSLTAIGARFGVAAETLAHQNAIAYTAIIHPGQRLRIHNPHIVPVAFDDGILINLPQRMLFRFRQAHLVAAYPVGLGKPTWSTPEGNFTIVSRVKNKPWLVPKSIQEEMRREGKAVLEKVPPGPDNPLGSHWLGMSMGGYGIHGTIAPSSIFQFRSHGCIRLRQDDVAELFGQVKVGTPGRLVYQPVLLAVVENGRILLEVHPDIYNKGVDPAQIARDMAEANGLSQDIDWSFAEAVIAAQDGVAHEVGRFTGRGLKGTP